MQTILLVAHVLIALALISLVLLQHGKGADMGAAFGSGASSTVFGSQGAGSFMTRTTAVLAALFFVTSLSLAFLGTRAGDVRQGSVVDLIETPLQAPGTARPAGETSDVPQLPSKPQ
jgi:preprotein translocase subunit SecG